ncbi:MAG: carbohydrate ABC transporter permease [Candidatus Competibacteraceae bacterium]|nr:carbohydrate ABC transporter permease [Candidatus Competibacteraceae bacterium]
MAAIRRTRADLVLDAANYAIMTIAVVVVIYPLYFIVIGSFSDPEAIYLGKAWLFPQNPSLEGYQRMFRDATIWIGYRNSLVYAILGTVINVSLTLPAAYALSRKDLAGRNKLMLLITFTMLFNGGLIPTYILVRDLGIYNTIWAMVLPNAVGVWNVIIARTYFQTTIPDDLLDSSVIDGCSNAGFFLRIVLPLSGALVAIMVLFYAVGHWNAFFNALIYLQSETLYPLQLVLRNILIANQVSDGMLSDLESVALQQRLADLIKYGVIIVASLPLLVLYPFLQKYFVKGVMIGAIKG